MSGETSCGRHFATDIRRDSGWRDEVLELAQQLKVNSIGEQHLALESRQLLEKELEQRAAAQKLSEHRTDMLEHLTTKLSLETPSLLNHSLPCLLLDRARSCEAAVDVKTEPGASSLSQVAMLEEGTYTD